MGLIPTKWDLALCNEVSASSFCRRRLPVVMVRSKMCGSVRMATKFVQQGHVRIGPEVVKDPAFLVTRYFLLFLGAGDSEQAGSSSEASDLWQRDVMSRSQPGYQLSSLSFLVILFSPHWQILRQ